jgi:hypothetical protein
MLIEIELKLEDYLKVMNLDEFDIERKIIQTSGADYIKINLQPERLSEKTPTRGSDSLTSMET